MQRTQARMLDAHCVRGGERGEGGMKGSGQHLGVALEAEGEPGDAVCPEGTEEASHHAKQREVQRNAWAILQSQMLLQAMPSERCFQLCPLQI